MVGSTPGSAHWKARFFDVDLGTVEVAPLSHVFVGVPTEPVTTIHGTQNAPMTRATRS